MIKRSKFADNIGQEILPTYFVKIPTNFKKEGRQRGGGSVIPPPPSLLGKPVPNAFEFVDALFTRELY